MTDQTTRPLAVRALSVRQPWADLILWGGKDVENRTWSVPSTMPEWGECDYHGRTPPDELELVTDTPTVGPYWRHWPRDGYQCPVELKGPFPFRIGIHASQSYDNHSDYRAWIALGEAWDLGPTGTHYRVSQRAGALLGYVTVTGCHHADECDHICPEHGCDECDDTIGACGHDGSWPVAPGSEADAREDPDAFWLSKCDVHGGPCENTCSPWANPRRDDDTDMWHWELEDPEPLDVPVPMRGALGLWRLDASTVQPFLSAAPSKDHP